MTDQPTVVNERELEWEERIHGERYEMYRKRLGVAAGGEELGCSLYEVPPDSDFGPYHYHTANEEALYVLEGSGSVRTPEGEMSIEAGDYVAMVSGEDGAHKVINDSDETLRYLCFSTMQDPDVVVYPDSDKYLLTVGGAPGVPFDEMPLLKIFPGDAEVDYWHGED